MKNKGFTLLEIMIVIAILGIVIVVAAPRMGGSKNDFKLYTSARNLVSDIRYAQELSISTKDNHIVFFNFDENWYEIRQIIVSETGRTLKTIKRVDFSGGITCEKIVDASGNSVGEGFVFDSTGKPFEPDETTAFTDLTTIYLKASNVYIYIKITPQTGEVSFGWN
ncbi:MAG: Tfp pilus assembly protein FimT/FimU [Ignavibacteriales bacterium]